MEGRREGERVGDGGGERGRGRDVLTSVSGEGLWDVWCNVFSQLRSERRLERLLCAFVIAGVDTPA